MSSITTDSAVPGSGQLHRTIDWRGAFWVASGVPRAGAVLDRRHRRHHRQSRLRHLDRLGDPRPDPVLHLCRDRRPVPDRSRAARRSMARRPGCAIPSSSRRCRCGATGSPGRRCCRSAARSRRLTYSARWRRSPGFGEASPEVVAWLADPANARQDGGRRHRRADGCWHAGDPRLDALQRLRSARSASRSTPSSGSASS